MDKGALFSLFMVLFAAILLLLRTKFRAPSRRSETAVLTLALILFFSMHRALFPGNRPRIVGKPEPPPFGKVPAVPKFLLGRDLGSGANRFSQADSRLISQKKD